MAGVILIDSIKRRLRESRRQKKLALARAWPPITAEINHWSVIPAEDDSAGFSRGFQIEATFHFTLNGGYFGGYVRSTGMSSTSAERLGIGSPTITVRYNPANHDETAVLTEDNVGKTPFEILSG